MKWEDDTPEELLELIKARLQAIADMQGKMLYDPLDENWEKLVVGKDAFRWN